VSTEIVRVGRLSFRNDVRRLTREDYERTRRTYLQYVASAFRPLAIYEYGRVRVSGISDLDFLIVIDEEVVNAPGRPPPLDDVGKYLVDRPVLIPSSLFGRLQHLIFPGDLTHLWGKEFTVDHVPHERHMMVSAALLCDVGHVLLHRLAKLNARSRLMVRQVLLRLHSIAHSGQLANQAGMGTDRSLDSFLGRVRALRERWIDDPDYRELAELLRLASPVLESLLRRLGERARTAGWYDEQDALPGKRTVQVTPTSFTSFGDPSEPPRSSEAAFSGPVISIGRSRFDMSLSVARLPFFAYRHFQACGIGSGPLRRAVRSRFGMDHSGSLSGEYRRMLEERMDLGESHWELINRARLLRHGQFPIYGLPVESVRRAGLGGWVVKNLPASVVGGLAHLWYRTYQ